MKPKSARGGKEIAGARCRHRPLFQERNEAGNVGVIPA
jgi:hypothetical protein